MYGLVGGAYSAVQIAIYVASLWSGRKKARKRK